MKREGMKTLNEICKKDGKFVTVIKELSVVKNAIDLLGGRRMIERRGERNENVEDEMEEGGKEEEEEKEGKGEEESEEEKGKKLIMGELRVKEKIGLLELLSRLVKRGVEMEDEEMLNEVGMMLEEEGNSHFEGEERRKRRERRREERMGRIE